MRLGCATIHARITAAQVNKAAAQGHASLRKVPRTTLGDAYVRRPWLD